jgi:tRNA (guanine37-N1)-methyltransferase
LTTGIQDCLSFLLTIFAIKIAMRIDILSGVPELLESPLNHSIIHRGKEKGIVEIYVHNLRDYSTDKHRSIDDYAFGGGAGMVMSIEPIDRAIQKLTSERNYDEIIYTAPEGERYTQKTANKYATFHNLIILCGHYKGVDQRVRDHLITKEISIGDYVLTGGELAAAVIVDSVVRLLPGVISDETSALTDSFQDDLLAPPVYTRPADYKGWKVPYILLSGNFPEIEKWREQKAIERTRHRRPDLLDDEDQEND